MSRLPLVVATLAGTAALLAAAPAGSPAPASPRAPASCKYVIKIIHGYRHRVRVCHRDKPVADLSVSITSSLQQMTAGNRLEYFVQVRNRGPKAAEDVVITVKIPADEVTLYGGGGGSVNCSTASGDGGKTIECKVFNLEPESTGDADTPPFSGIVLLVQAEPDEAGALAAVAEVKAKSRDPHLEDNRVIEPLTVLPGPASADMTVAVHGSPNPATVPEDFAETISVTNNGPSEATPAFVTVLLPQGTTIVQVLGQDFLNPFFFGFCAPYYASGPSTLTVCWDTVEPGETQTATVMLAASSRAPPNLETNALVSSYTKDPSLVNNRTSDTIALMPFHGPRGVDLAVSLKSPTPSPVVAGREFEIPIRVINLGGDVAHDVHITVSVTPDLQSVFGAVSVGSLNFGFGIGGTQCSTEQLPLDCTFPTLESGDRLIGVVEGVPASAGSYSLTVSVSSSSGDLIPGDNGSSLAFDVKRSRALR